MLVPADTPGVLQPLQELPLPAPASWAPQTVGWWVVGFVLFAALAWCAWAAWRHHRKQRYRRVALAHLERIEAALKNPEERVSALAAIRRSSSAPHLRSRPASAWQRLAARSGYRISSVRAATSISVAARCFRWLATRLRNRSPPCLSTMRRCW